jgi:asparagine synthase (glutamine-hydrolysing)
MCGIAGIVSLGPDAPPVARSQLARMAKALAHRGPDEFGVYRDARAGLTHARLSIIDLTSGQQPLANEDGTLWIVFNGEIFNYVELRGELEGLGHRFRTRSDTEVIVHAWEAWGEAAFVRLNGQWAVALWDTASRRLVLSRDPFGVRPLYFAERGGRLIFASEVKAMFAGVPELPRQLDPLGLEQTFTFWTVVPPQTVFQGILELEPGHTRIYEPGKAVRDLAYWRASYSQGEDHLFAGTLDDAVVALRDALERATRLRMVRADVPVGSYLSGGLDSSVVAALAKEACPAGFKTFSLRFQDAEYDETPFQRAMAERLGTEHADILVSQQEIAEAFPSVVWHAERPILRTAPAPLFLLSRLVREHGIKVVLTGEGADEMLAGYDLFREAKIRRFWARSPDSAWRPRLLERLYPYMARSPVAQRATTRQFFGRGLENAQSPGFSHAMRWHGTAALKRLFSGAQRQAVAAHDVTAEFLASLPPEFARWPTLAQDQYIEVRTLMSGYLLSSQGDRMLMANSVEGRFPFLDKEVVALANSLPPAYKLNVLDEKYVLKCMAKDLVPSEIVSRPKQPYRAPDALCFVGPSRPAWADEVMRPEPLEAAGVFEPKAASRLWDKGRKRHAEGQFSNADNMAIVGILSTQLLHRDFVVAAPSTGDVTFNTMVDRVAPALVDGHNLQ